jgi:ABC-type transport system involved in multi-copper enzyme maturation permease subunit
MLRLVGAELLKLRTTRSFWAQVSITLGLIVTVTVLTLAFDSGFYDEQRVRNVLSTGFASGLLMLVLGVVFSAGEYRHGTIAWTVLVTPNRWRVSAAQTLAAAVAGLVVGAATAGLTAAIALPWLESKDAVELSTSELLEVFGGAVVYTSLAAALGAAVGALLRNQVAAVVVVLVLLLVVDPVASALEEDYARYSLQGLGIALTGGNADSVSGGDLLPFGGAALLWAAYTAGLVVAAGAVTSRRDL